MSDNTDAMNLEVEELKQQLESIRAERQALVKDQRSMDNRLFNFQSLLRAARALHNCKEIPELMSVLKAIISDKLDATGIWIFLYDEDEKHFRLQLAYDGKVRKTDAVPKSGDAFSFMLQPGILWQLVCQGVSFSVVDLDGNFRFPELFAATKLDRFSATQWLPLVMNNEPKGLVWRWGRCAAAPPTVSRSRSSSAPWASRRRWPSPRWT